MSETMASTITKATTWSHGHVHRVREGVDGVGSVSCGLGDVGGGSSGELSCASASAPIIPSDMVRKTDVRQNGTPDKRATHCCSKSL